MWFCIICFLQFLEEKTNFLEHGMFIKFGLRLAKTILDIHNILGQVHSAPGQ